MKKIFVSFLSITFAGTLFAAQPVEEQGAPQNIQRQPTVPPQQQVSALPIAAPAESSADVKNILQKALEIQSKVSLFVSQGTQAVREKNYFKVITATTELRQLATQAHALSKEAHTLLEQLQKNGTVTDPQTLDSLRSIVSLPDAISKQSSEIKL